MSSFRPSRVSLAIIGASAVGLIVWTALVVTGTLDRFDATTVAPPLAPGSAWAQIFAALAIVTWPGVAYLVMVILAFWSLQRRLRSLGIAILLSVALGVAVNYLMKAVIARPRPDSPHELITNHGYAYPSTHVTATVLAMIMVVAVVTVTRQSLTNQGWWRTGAAALVLLVAFDRWILNAHWISDLVGAVLLGVLLASVSLVIARVRVLPDSPLEAIALARPKKRKELATAETETRRCAVVFNPTKVLDQATFRRHVEYELSIRGWDRPLWLETTPRDPGYQMAAVAVRKKVDLVLGVGGDGTIRAVCEGLADTGIRFAIIPAGTGNLLARNLGVPLDESDALKVAFDGEPRQIDLVRLRTDDGQDSHVFSVMAGMGIDAVIMEQTNADLKKTVGSAAYFIAAARNAKHPALPVTVTVDDEEPFKRRASVIVLGNVGFLQGGIQLIPGARADDGRLDLMIASPRTPADWARLTAKVLTRRNRGDDRMDRISATKVRIEAERTEPFQLDGDTVGTCHTMEAEVLPGALTLQMPIQVR